MLGSTKEFFRMGAVAWLFAAAATTASAGQITYTSLPFPAGAHSRADDLAAATPVETKFLGTLSSFSTNTLDTVPAGDLGKSNPTLTFGAITANTTFGAGTSSGGVQGVSATFAVSGANALVAYPVTPTNTNLFTFSQAITAFGSYFIQVGDSGANTITMRFQNTVLGTSKDVVLPQVGPSAGFFNVFYFGYTDTDPFNVVTLLPSNAGDGLLMDNITAGNVAVPEPASLALLACGLAWPLAVHCRRRGK